MKVKEAVQDLDLAQLPTGRQMYVMQMHEEECERMPPMMLKWINQLRVKRGGQPLDVELLGGRPQGHLPAKRDRVPGSAGMMKLAKKKP